MMTKSRIKYLKVGDVFSFSDTLHPKLKVIGQKDGAFKLAMFPNMDNRDSVQCGSNRFIIIFNNDHPEVIPFIKKTYKCTQTGQIFTTLQEAANYAGVSKQWLCLMLRRSVRRGRRCTNSTTIIEL